MSEVKLERGESFTLETENLVVKAVDWDPDAAAAVDELIFPVRYRRKDKTTSRRRTVPFWDDDDGPPEEIVSIFIDTHLFTVFKVFYLTKIAFKFFR